MESPEVDDIQLGGGVAVVVLLAGFFFHDLRPRLPWFVKAKTVSGRAHTIAVTSLRGSVYSPVFSPDGKQIAFFWNGKDQNKSDIYVQLIGGEQPCG